ncbi:hypothetical protein [Salmonella phage SilasIsHot]|uniref:Uncharacterized protein n=1 Tax=Salmonella phage vB_STmST313_KE31 TaxID=3161181 RepID=A0AAU8GM23_9CAUD|nr:hypothetical protein [Salmonella phage SilasIsHot]
MSWGAFAPFLFGGVYVPASHLNRDFITTENIVRWEIATQSDIDEHPIFN